MVVVMIMISVKVTGKDSGHGHRHGLDKLQSYAYHMAQGMVTNYKAWSHRIIKSHRCKSL